jgi:fructose-1-phosphate kinase PfkB-like protein
VTAPIHTLTGNLLAERTFDYDSWESGKTQRAAAASFQVGGKGINVSKMLRRLGAPTTALCFAGGHAGAECLDWLRAQAFNVQAFPTRNPTRTGLVVRSAGRKETTFLGPDTPPDAAAFRSCAACLDALPDHAILALCGSFPGWDSDDARPLRDALERLITRATVCADTYGPTLSWLAVRPVALVKINREEFDRFLPPRESCPPSILQRLENLKHQSPVKNWIITDGPREVAFVTPASAPAAVLPPPVEEVSPTGSGDVFFACVLEAWLNRDFTLADAIHFALPFSSANAAHPGIADFPMNQIP